MRLKAHPIKNGLKICNQCLVKKKVTNFQPRKKGNPNLRSECKACHYRKHRPWIERNVELLKMARRKRAIALRMKALEIYGKECQCCGESTYEFLAIDHINGGGNKHRKSIKESTIYQWLQNNNYPIGFQVLCHNCNQAKSYYKKCPHKNY